MGAPASARTTLTPTVLSSVLLPDMFDPLTTTTCGCEPPSFKSFATETPSGISG